MHFRTIRLLLAVALIGTNLLAANLALAQIGTVPPAIAQAFDRAAQDGPAALLEALSRSLAGNPSLAASPPSAAALAHAAAVPVSGFAGANLPVYRSIVQRISAAAPPAQREAVTTAVAEEVGRIAQADRRAQPVAPPALAGGSGTEGAFGVRAGSFIVYPDIQAGVFYDSNIYATRTDRKSDFVGVLSPSLTIESDWSRHSLSASAQVDFTNYRRYTDENTIDWQGSIEGRVDASDTMQIYVGALALRDHEDRSSPDAVAGFEPTTYDEMRGYAGISERFGDVTVRLGGAIERLTFESVLGQNGLINNKDRDRDRITAGALIRHAGASGVEPFLEVLADIRSYHERVDDFGFERSSQGFRLGGGMRLRVAGNLRGEVFLGVMRQEYDDPRFKPIAAPAAAISVRWTATPATQIVAYLDRSIEETTLPGSPGYLHSVVGLRVEQMVDENVLGILRASVGRSDFSSVARTDDEFDLSAGLRYRLTRNVAVGADYRFTQRDSNVPNADYNRHQVYLRLGAQF